MIADSGFYSFNYGAAARIPEEHFMLWEKRAEAELTRLTSGRLSEAEITYSIKLCICEIAEALYIADSRHGIASENNDGYSVSYDKEAGKNGGNILAIAKRYLAGTDLLYRGV